MGMFALTGHLPNVYVLCSGALGKVPRSPEAEKKNVELQNPTTVLKQDLRQFECKTWCLEPTVRSVILSLESNPATLTCGLTGLEIFFYTL